MNSSGRVHITVEWLDGKHQTLTLSPGPKWGWRTTMREGIPLLVIRLKEGHRLEIPISNVKLWHVDTSERVDTVRVGSGLSSSGSNSGVPDDGRQDVGQSTIRSEPGGRVFACGPYGSNLSSGRSEGRSVIGAPFTWHYPTCPFPGFACTCDRIADALV